MARLDGALSSLGVGAAEQATASAAKLTMVALVRKLMFSPACQRRGRGAGSDTAPGEL